MTEVKRLPEVDLIRSLGILMILAAHLPDYIVLVPWLVLFHSYFVLLGLGLFFFVSGAVLDLNYSVLTADRTIIVFMRKRMLRIYPLYIVALATFVVVFGHLGIHHSLTFSPGILLVHLAGMQIIFSPIIHPIFTLWFIGLVVLYYLVFIVINRFSTTFFHTTFSAIVVLLIFVGIRSVSGILDLRFFLYYSAFVAGILSNQAGLFSLGRTSTRPILLLLLATIGSAGVIGVLKVLGLPLALYEDRTHSMAEHLPSLVAANIFIISGAVLTLLVAGRLTRKLPRKAQSVFFLVAFASYPVYLFHRPILSILSEAFSSLLGAESVSASILVIILGLPIVFFVSYCLQMLQDRFVTVISSRKVTNLLPGRST